MNKHISGITTGMLAVLLLIAWMSSVAQGELYNSRGYLTTPQELLVIAQKANQGIEPYDSAVEEVLDWANRDWDYKINNDIRCRGADDPRWIDERGAGIVYASALAYHLTGDDSYADSVKQIIEEVMTSVIAIPDDIQQCRLNFAWGTPEYVAAADLIEIYWQDLTCSGPISTDYGDATIDDGNCKRLFQNWLVKNPYYVVSYSSSAQSNWGAAATNTIAYIADYLWDRPDVVLLHRNPPKRLNGAELRFTPAEAYEYARQLTLDRLNGHGVEYDSNSSCDYLSGRQQDDDFEPAKSQITERGIITEDARREERCNIERYDGDYQNYPQIHISNTVQQCELMLRRGDHACYDNIRLDDIPEYRFVGPDGEAKVTHLYPGRGSIERAINAIIVDSGTEWRHDAALYVAYRYYLFESNFGLVPAWYEEMDRSGSCSQGICFGQLTHGFALDENPGLPPTTLPPN